MKIALAQLRPRPGDIEHNSALHLRLVEEGVKRGADLIFFPELSLTGYNSSLACQLATRPEDAPTDALQNGADIGGVTIGVGFPTIGKDGVRISMIFLRPEQEPVVYSKQYLHEGESDWFVPGKDPLVLGMKDQVLAPAICYESLLTLHADEAARHGATVYMAGVANSQGGVDRAYAHYPMIARQHSMAVMMANCLGPCDDIIAAGGSALWNREGEMIARLDGEEEGILLYDTADES